MSEHYYKLLQHKLARWFMRVLTVFAGWVASGEWGWLTTTIIRRFIRRYAVNMAEAAKPDPASYPTFNAFFTRALRKGARPISSADWVCPVDGEVSQLGAIKRDQILQAKGHRYSTRALLGGDAALAAKFDDGYFATIYLSPRDYHRIHMPCDGTLKRMIYVPGDLFSVNPSTARHVPGLFARNERVVCEFETAHGPLAMVLVGATIVGSMYTVWHGVVNPPRSPDLQEWHYEGEEISLKQGAEMGRFLLGSTVVLLWPQQPLRLNPDWEAGWPVRLGEKMGILIP